ncbi:MAG: Type 1 glutamine amidotransferase-like domain-containing protein [Actinomycetota bacterium]
MDTGAQGSVLALVGGAEWTAPAVDLDAWLLEQSGTTSVTVLPTANRVHPDMAMATARRHFARLGGEVVEASVLIRADAEQPSWQERLSSAAFLYLAGGDPGYLASVLAGTPAWAGIAGALARGAVLAGSSAGAMVLCGRMLRPGSAATEAGLGLLGDVLVLPHHEQWPARLGQVASVLAGEGMGGVQVLGIDECTGLVLESTGSGEGSPCRVLGAGSVTSYRLGGGAGGDGKPALVASRVERAPTEIDGGLAGLR